MSAHRPNQNLPSGLPMVAAKDERALSAEKDYLLGLEQLPRWQKCLGYLRLSGPGFLQGALTLGGGTAASSLFAGSLLGYKLLWVQPVAMLLGLVMLNALAHQTLSTGIRPFEAVRRFVHPAAAWSWALASLLASIVWSLPQFNLAASVVTHLGVEAGTEIPTGVTSFLVLAITVTITWNYNRGSRALRAYESLLKVMVGLIVLAFFLVVLKTGVDWEKLWKGYFAFHLPEDAEGRGVVISSFATAVGINMTFLLPYTMLARGWGREHRTLARFDLSAGLFIPFVLATSFIIIAAANVVHPSYDPAMGKPSAVSFAKALEPLVGPVFSHWVFGLGILAMTLTTIPLLMLVCGFIVVEIFRVSPQGWGYRLGTLLPSLGVLGPLIWGKLGFWIAVPTSVFCFFLLPVAYVSFWVLQNRSAYLRGDLPRGRRRVFWNLAMGVAVLVVLVGGVYEIVQKAAEMRAKL